MVQFIFGLAMTLLVFLSLRKFCGTYNC